MDVSRGTLAIVGVALTAVGLIIVLTQWHSNEHTIAGWFIVMLGALLWIQYIPVVCDEERYVQIVEGNMDTLRHIVGIIGMIVAFIGLITIGAQVLDKGDTKQGLVILIVGFLMWLQALPVIGRRSKHTQGLRAKGWRDQLRHLVWALIGVCMFFTGLTYFKSNNTVAIVLAIVGVFFVFAAYGDQITRGLARSPSREADIHAEFEDKLKR